MTNWDLVVATETTKIKQRRDESGGSAAGKIPYQPVAKRHSREVHNQSCGGLSQVLISHERAVEAICPNRALTIRS